MIALFAIGAASLAFGLFGLRVMARRSVSLALLRALRDGADPRPAFDAAIAARIDDAIRHGLVREERGRLLATARGRAVVALVAALRRCFGVRAS